jgi:hypothetical protein
MSDDEAMLLRVAGFEHEAATYDSADEVADELKKLWGEWKSICKRVHDARMFFQKIATSYPKGSEARNKIDFMWMELINMERGKNSVNVQSMTDLEGLGYRAESVAKYLKI